MCHPPHPFPLTLSTSISVRWISKILVLMTNSSNCRIVEWPWSDSCRFDSVSNECWIEFNEQHEHMHWNAMIFLHLKSNKSDYDETHSVEVFWQRKAKRYKSFQTTGRITLTFVYGMEKRGCSIYCIYILRSVRWAAMELLNVAVMDENENIFNMQTLKRIFELVDSMRSCL